MATLTDEEKVKQLLGDVEEETPAETTEEPEAPAEEEQNNQEQDNQVESAEDKSDLEPEEAAIAESSEQEETKAEPFTKQFPNLKGETLAEYVPELEKAYQNSFTEALRIKKELDDSKALVEEAKRIIAGVQTVPPPAAPENPQVPAPAAPQPNPLLLAIDEHPAIQYAKAKQNEDMFAAFDTFAKDFPQARDEDGFAAFQKASNGINQALTDTLGRVPTYLELFKGIAGSLGWQPARAKRDAAIKDMASSPQVASTAAPISKGPKVPEASIVAYQKMLTSKTREEAIKDLSTVV
jgi:hypothetical protein